MTDAPDAEKNLAGAIDAKARNYYANYLERRYLMKSYYKFYIFLTYKLI
jgi:hypothetical protein